MNPTDFPAPHRTMDARGKFCPLPTVKASLALEEMQAGQVLELLADDPVTQRDFPAWCRERGHEVLGLRENGVEFSIFIRKKG